MTKRIKGFTITLEEDYREEDAEVVKKAIEMIRGVADVTYTESTGTDHMNREMIKAEFKTKIFRSIHETIMNF